MDNTTENAEDLDNECPTKQTKNMSFQSKLRYNIIRQNINKVLAIYQQI